MAGFDLTSHPLIARVRNILVTPRQFWTALADDVPGIVALYVRHAVILAAIPAVSLFVRAMIFGLRDGPLVYFPEIGTAFMTAAVRYILSLVSVSLIALVVEFIAGILGSETERRHAFALAIYASSAAWLAGLCQLVPGLGFLGYAGYYSFYLLYTGTGPMLRLDGDRALGACAMIAVVAFVIMGLASALVEPLSGHFTGSVPMEQVGG